MYEEYEPKYLLEYDPNNIDSIKAAALKYGELIKTRKGFKNNYCVVQFKPTEIISSVIFDGYPKLKDIIITRYNTKEKSLEKYMFTETLFFLNAMRFSALEAIIIETAEAVVKFSRDNNDSSDMWISCEEPFALEWLGNFCRISPKYGYLLAAFLIPYWDDEHMPEALTALEGWSNNWGITDDTIKAFCYCDNSSARMIMLGIDIEGYYPNQEIESDFDLLTYFRASPEAYSNFKKILAERYRSQPFLQYTSDERYYITNPISSIVKELLMVHHFENEEKDQYLQCHFVTKSAALEIEEIKQYIEEENQTAMIPPYRQYIEQLNEIEKSYLPNANFDNCWKGFLIDSFPNGKDLWQYVNEGGTTIDLTTIAPLENLYKLIDHYDNALIQVFEQQYIHSNSDLYEDLERVLIEHFKAWKKEGFINGSDKNKILRLLDLIFCWFDRKPFEDDVEEAVTSKYQVCTLKEFENRYKSNWFSELEHLLKKYGGYTDTVTYDDLNACYILINENRREAIEKVPNTLFLKQEKRDCKGYGIVEILVFSSYLVAQDVHQKQEDLLTSKAKTFLSDYLFDIVLEDLISEMEFSALNIVGGKVQPPPQYYQEEERKKQALLAQAYTEFISSFQKEGQQEVTSRFFYEYLKYDKREPISAHQKNIDWLNNYSDKTQKLFVALHYLFNIEGIRYNNNLQLIFKLTINAGPVKVIHFLSKVYKEHPYRCDDIKNILSMLEQFIPLGLSKKGYWAYLIEQLYEGSDPDDTLEYQEILKIWLGEGTQSKCFRGLVSPIQKDLKEGVLLLPYRLQNQLLAEAKKVVDASFFEDKYAKALVNYMERKLHSEFMLNDYALFFKNKLKGEGLFCEYIKWDTWHEHSHLLEEVLSEVDLKREVIQSAKKAQEELYAVKGWRYIILQRVKGKLNILYGKEILAHLQDGFSIENIYSAQTHAIIIDESCPQEYIDKLLTYDKENYRKEWVDLISNYLLSGSKETEVEQILRYGVNKWRFTQKDDYSETSIQDLFANLNEQQQKRILFVQGCVSEEALDLELEIKPSEYYQLLVDSNIDYPTIYKYLVKYMKLMNPNLYLSIFKKTDAIALIEKEKIEVQLPMLSIMVHLPQYHDYILGQKESTSIKIREQAQLLIEKYGLSKKKEKYQLVDYGVYNMLGDTTPENGSHRKTAREPILLLGTKNIYAKVGMFIGVRFTALNLKSSREICYHTVSIKHPVLLSNGTVGYTTSKWKQNGFCNTLIFVGWHFEKQEELIAGVYVMSAYNDREELILEEEFNVKV